MLTDRPEWRAWLARHDAQAFARQEYGSPPRRERPNPDLYDSCEGPLGDTPSQVGEECIVCLAERFGGDLVEERVIKTLLGGLVKIAMKSDDIAADDLVVSTVQEAIREYESETGFAFGRLVTKAA